MLSFILTANVLFCIILLQVIYVQRTRAKEVCCETTGCFTDAVPFDSMPLPECTEPVQDAPSFNLYSREDWYTAKPITPSETPSTYSDDRPTYLIAHGWINKGDTKWVLKMKDELMKKADINVVVVDWHELANRVWYPQSASNVRTVGAHAARIVESLKARSDHSSYFYCIGHSLGAHVCAHAGLKTHFDRISGLDPAGPWFDRNDVEIGLNSASADFVDVVHTNNLYGTTRPIGHVDFYPNGGKNQPGCLGNVCSHNIVPDFYIESIKKDCFVATKNCSDFNKIPKSCVECKGCALMGHGTHSSSRGIMYLKTSKKAPYCLPV